MPMTKTRTIVVGMALGLVACPSATSHPDAATPPHDAAVVPTLDMGTTPPQDTGTTVPVDMGTTAPTDAGCSTPTTLHPPRAGSTANIYCPLFGTTLPDGGHSLYCSAPTQHCCLPASGSGTCDPTATACGATDLDFRCQDPGDCATGQHCCGTGTLVLGGTGCGNFASHFTGTVCAASCDAATQITMCTSNGECASGHMCVPFKTHGADVGGCM